ncbi:MAG: ABC transporter permease [Culicoidibacterales bacterium]
MNYLKRAIISVTRQPIKSIGLLLIIFLLGNVMIGALAIEQAISNIEQNVKNNLSVVASVEPDYDNLAQWSEGERLSVEMINKIGKSPYVKAFDYSEGAIVEGPSYQLIISEEGSMYNITSDGVSYDLITFSLVGTSYAPILDVEQGEKKLVSGRTFTQDEITKGRNSAIISQNFAQLNNLSVGQTMEFKNIVRDTTNEEVTKFSEYEIINTENVALEIIGIVTKEPKQQPKKNREFIESEQVQFDNEIIVPNLLAKNVKASKILNGELPQNTIYSPIFFLTTPDVIEAFETEMIGEIPGTYKIITAQDSYEKIASAIESVSYNVKSTTIITIGVGVLILSLIILLILRERKKELAIYLAIGEVKFKVALQCIIEVMIITFVGLGLALFSGSILVDNVSQKIISNEIVVSNDSRATIGGVQSRYLDLNVSEHDFIEYIGISITVKFITIIFVVISGTSLTATIIPIYYILRITPQKILL